VWYLLHGDYQYSCIAQLQSFNVHQMLPRLVSYLWLPFILFFVKNNFNDNKAKQLNESGTCRVESDSYSHTRCNHELKYYCGLCVSSQTWIYILEAISCCKMLIFCCIVGGWVYKCLIWDIVRRCVYKWEISLTLHVGFVGLSWTQSKFLDNIRAYPRSISGLPLRPASTSF
jgi:hypothetical protein